MNKTKVKDGNYYVVQSFMVSQLKLKGLEKEVYAIIYGFSQTDGQAFNGSIQYLCDWTGASRQGIMNALKKLVEKNLIAKKEVFINGVKFVEYLATEFTPSQESLQGGSTKFTGGSQLSLHNNINNNINNNNSIKERKKEDQEVENKKTTSFDKIIEDYTNDEETKMLLGEWLKVRKAKRAALTDYAISLNIKKLDNLAAKSNMTVNQYLREVIARGWNAFYEIKNYNFKGDNNNDKNRRSDEYPE